MQTLLEACATSRSQIRFEGFRQTPAQQDCGRAGVQTLWKKGRKQTTVRTKTTLSSRSRGYLCSRASKWRYEEERYLKEVNIVAWEPRLG